LSLFDERLFVNLVYYELSNVDQWDAINSAPSGHVGNENNHIWNAIADYTGDPKYESLPYSSTGQGWGDTADNTSEGVELSVTANLTDNWRFTINGSKRGDATTQNRGEITKRYFEEYLPIIESNPEWMNLVTQEGNGPLVSERVDTIRTMLANFDAIKGVPVSVYAPQWTMNLVTNYTFSKSSVLKGFSVGGSMNARGKS
jgi:outer membrane receptor protein involved in Fe transport